MQSKCLARKNIIGLSPYIPGRPIEEVKRQLGLKEVIKLASNENPLGVSPKAKEAMKRALDKVNRYPDGNCFYLKNALAKKLRLKPENLIFGNGSDELIDVIIKAFVEDDEEVLTSEATFLEYAIVSTVNNRAVVTTPLKYYKYDLPALKAKITRKTKLVFIANPNNPTGTYVTKQEVAEFMRGLPEHVIVVFDEAYDLFVDVNDYPDSMSLFARNNVIILKTFSKAYGLAGVRVGFAIAQPELIAFMEKARQPFNVNLLAQAAAMAAIDDKKFLKATRETVLSGKRYLYSELEKMGLGVVPTVANFMLVNTPRESTAIFKDMLKFGVIVRDMREYGLKNFIRVTIGTKKENERFVRVLKKVL